MDQPFVLSSSFPDRRDSYAPSMTSSQSTMSLGGSFDTSFSSDVSSSLSSSFSSPSHDIDNPFEISEWCPSSAASFRSNTPPEQVYGMSTMTNSMLGLSDQNMMFATPPKHQLAPSLMGYDFPYVNDIYNPLECQDFMGTPGLAYDTGSSPMADVHTPSPQGRGEYVIPSQTFLDTFEPSTPVHSANMSFGHISPSSSAYPATGLRYFISPVVETKQEHHSPSPFHSASSSMCSTPSRKVPSGFQAMECSDILHRVTDSAKVRKNKSRSLIGIVPEGKYKCTHPGCKSEHAFKRQEHLKRHMKTHVAQKDLQCSYCHKKFQQDRSDNYRSHVKLHSKQDSKGSRTKYFAAAEDEVRSWEKDRSRSGHPREFVASTPLRRRLSHI